MEIINLNDYECGEPHCNRTKTIYIFGDKSYYVACYIHEKSFVDLLIEKGGRGKVLFKIIEKENAKTSTS